MQAEMQPLVSQHPDKRLLGLVFIFPDIVVFHFKQDWLASPVILLRDKSPPRNLSSVMSADKERLEVFHFSSSRTSG